MKCMKYCAAVLLISTFCTMHSGVKKFATELCQILSQEDKKLFQELLALRLQIYQIKYALENSNISVTEKAGLERQISELNYFLVEKASASGNEKFNLMVDRFDQIVAFNHQHMINVDSVIISELTRKNNK